MDPERPVPTSYPEDRPRAATIRSRLVLEIASDLVGQPTWAPKQARIQFRSQGGDEWTTSLFGSDAPSAIPAVASGEVSFAIINPATVASLAVSGVPPFDSAIPLRAIATIPSHDQLGIAAAPDSGIETLADLGDAPRPLRISLRGGRPDHAVHMVVGHVLEAAGFGIDELAAQGHTIGYDEGIPHQPPRADLIAAGDIDVIIDEGVYNWVEDVAGRGWRLLGIPESALASLEAIGYRRARLERRRYPALDSDVPTIDFSGWMVYTHARVDDEVVTAFCEALLRRRDRIPWQGGPSLPIEQMVADTTDAPIPIPLHPAAELCWVRHGLLDGATRRV